MAVPLLPDISLPAITCLDCQRNFDCEQEHVDYHLALSLYKADLKEANPLKQLQASKKLVLTDYFQKLNNK